MHCVVYVPGKLDTPSAIVMDFALVVLPRDTKGNGSFWLGKCHKGAFVKVTKIGILKERNQVRCHFFNCLDECGLIRIFRAQIIEKGEIVGVALFAAHGCCWSRKCMC